MFRTAYWLFSYLGLMTVAAAFLVGFRYEPSAPLANLWYDLALYAAFALVHIVMTMPAVKRLLFRRAAGTPFERRVYIVTTVVTWLAVYALHRPIGGFGWQSPEWLALLGYCIFLLAMVSFYEFSTFENLGMFLGVPGAELAFSAGAETPLMTTGGYSRVRHPMYRAAFVMNFASLLIHPNASQLVFAVLVTASFLLFIPFEERQLLKARGDEYRAYMAATPYRVFRGLW
ncbi:MAG: isoprenylcysteine carboxylmethyltransferase family protein [Pirellulales bacterium]